MTNSSDFDQLPHRDLFKPQTLALMTRVLEAAWKEAQMSCGGSAKDRSIIRASLARGIIEAIEAGETDADRLRQAALSELYRDDE